MRKHPVQRTLERGANGAKVVPGPDGLGLTEFDKKTRKPTTVHVPQSESARSRTIRLHELIHARTTSPRLRKYRKFAEATRQLTEDCRVHSLKWPRGNPRIDRDAMTMAVQDIRSASPDAMGLYGAIRAVAILQWIGSPRHVSNPCTMRRIRIIMRDKYGRHVWDKIRDAVKQLNRDTYAGDVKAHSIIQELLSMQDRIDNLTDPDGAPPSERQPATDGDRSFEIIELPRTQPCENEPRKRKAFVGSRLNVSAYVRSVATGAMNPLYRKRVVSKPQGTVLIDASGSMAPTQEELIRLASLIPAAQIAFYCGTCEGNGWLTIVAKDGLRAATIEPPRGWSNEVDDLALEWLLRQPGPRRFLTDLEFTCPNWQAWQEQTLKLHHAGVIELIRADSINALIDLFS